MRDCNGYSSSATMARLEPNYSNSSKDIVDFTDPRVMKWTFISSPASLICISLLYVFVVYFAGPRFMRNRQPYSLKGYMQFYNVLQVIVNFWIVFNSVAYGKWFASVWRFCDSYDNICSHNGEKPLELAWWALLVKIIDLSETIVFVLRKKDHQISYLHVYHHLSTMFLLWVMLRYVVHAYILYLMILNCGVHVIMYSYYFLSTHGPKVQKRIRPFKRWLTILQMAHITMLMIPGLQGFTSHCDVKSKYISVILLCNGTVNLLLFWNFYKKAYKRPKAA